MTIQQFCDKHKAPYIYREWITENCESMSDAWDKAYPRLFMWIAECDGVLDDNALRLFFVYCARTVQHITEDPRAIRCIDISEQYAHGLATDSDLKRARKNGWRLMRELECHSDQPSDWNEFRRYFATMCAVRCTDECLKEESKKITVTIALAQSYNYIKKIEKHCAEWLRSNTKPNFN